MSTHYIIHPEIPIEDFFEIITANKFSMISENLLNADGNYIHLQSGNGYISGFEVFNTNIADPLVDALDCYEVYSEHDDKYYELLDALEEEK